MSFNRPPGYEGRKEEVNMKNSTNLQQEFFRQLIRGGGDEVIPKKFVIKVEKIRSWNNGLFGRSVQVVDLKVYIADKDGNPLVEIGEGLGIPQGSTLTLDGIDRPFNITVG